MISDIVIKEFVFLARSKGWSMRHISKKLGFSHVYLVNVINKREVPSHHFIAKIFSFLMAYQYTYQKFEGDENKVKFLR